MGVSVPGSWRLQSQRYRLVGEVCDHCGQKIFPPRDICPECRTIVKLPEDETLKMVRESRYGDGKERGG